MRDLISGKRRWSSRPNRDLALKGFKGWHERGYLPHRDEPGLIQFVTFRLVDAFPAGLRSEWAALLDLEDQREQRKKLESYLDRGRGECRLRRPELARLVEDTLRFHHPRLYELRAWVVMANHVHVLFKVDQKPMGAIMAGWKQYIARIANKLLQSRGPFWAKDFWDTYIRDSEHESRARRYIEGNPVKALLVRAPEDWPWSSARFRDAHGSLRL